MDEDRFRIVADPARKLLRIALLGHWDVAAVSRYKAALGNALATMRAAGCARGSVSALVDIRAAGPQSQDVVAAWSHELDTAAFSPRRLATLVTSALLKRQVDRIAIPNQRLFDNEDEAMAWLMSDGTAG